MSVPIEIIEKALRMHLRAPQTPERLKQAMHYATLGAGKRFRAKITLAAGAVFDLPPQGDLLDLACAIECVHAFSLIHDDLPAMDDGPLRRGKPTTHIAFDEATAILAGNALMALGFEIVAKLKANSTIRSDLSQLMAQAVGRTGMIGGQLLDLQQSGRFGQTPNTPVNLSARVDMQNKKTGAVIALACESGAIIAGEPMQTVKRMRKIGLHMGLAFQIKDDLLDQESDPQTLGKETQKDHKQNKSTLVALLGRKGAQARLDAELNAARALLEPHGPKARDLRTLVHAIDQRDR